MFALVKAGPRLLILAVLAVAYLSGGPGWGQESRNEERGTLFLNLTTDDPWTAQMALFYASTVQEMGYPVVVFLNTRAVSLADRTIPQASGGISGQPPRETLQRLIAAGAQVHVCGMCARQAGLRPENWLEGAIAAGQATVRLQMAPTTRIMSF